jgi:hypothetical protein
MDIVQGPLPSKEDGLVTRNIVGETIIVPVRSNVAEIDSIYTLNEVASLVWGMIDGQTTVNQLTDAICKSYEVTPEEATKDLDEFLGTLESAGLIRFQSGGGTWHQSEETS